MSGLRPRRLLISDPKRVLRYPMLRGFYAKQRDPEPKR